jgi:adenylate kinase
VRQWLGSHGRDGFILDGFPRTIGQARAFDEPIDTAFHLALSDEEIRERVTSRITCTHCGASFSEKLHAVREGDACPACGEVLVRRRDDTPHAIVERLEQHRLHTAPVIEFYRERGLLIDVDAATGRDAVFHRLCAIIEEAVPA